MNNDCANYSIKCNVTDCMHHCDSENFCSLDCVCIGTHEDQPSMDQCTDCCSFEQK